MLHYLVSYLTESKHGTRQIRRKLIERSEPILTEKDCLNIEIELKKGSDFNNVVLLSFSKLEGKI